MEKKLIAALRGLAQRLEEGARPIPGQTREMMLALTRWTDDLRGKEAVADAPEKNPGPAPLAAPAPVASGGVIRIWCDGSCAPNPGAGGWGVIIERDSGPGGGGGSGRKELSGADPDSTNNMMELTAAIEGLRHTPPGAVVHICTDSKYVQNGITQWIHGWKRKGWRKSDGKPVLNQGLWQALDEAASARRVTWEWVRGHSGHPENERCDELANEARRALAI